MYPMFLFSSWTRLPALAVAFIVASSLGIYGPAFGQDADAARYTIPDDLHRRGPAEFTTRSFALDVFSKRTAADPVNGGFEDDPVDLVG